jgi:signal transduction histidine kinase
MFLALGLYSVSSEAMNAAIARGTYYSGSAYDLPFLAALCWLIYAAFLGRDLKPRAEIVPPPSRYWIQLVQRLAMLAILSLPGLGFWAILFDTSLPKVRHFRLFAMLAAMLLLGVCILVRQYLLDRQLVRLLDESQQSFENLQRLQSQLVQKEKLASLGQLVAGAAHELNNPLTSILGYSELLETDPGLKADQISMVRKIGQQAHRTCELVSGLLSFAQQSPGEKALLDVGPLLQRAASMEKLHLENRKIRIDLQVGDDLPLIRGNFNQLLQCFLQIMDNAVDALEEVGGGSLTVSARREGQDAVIEFADSGPGVREPERVFDPFYTTKPIGKGTGLGLSASYGVIQDHQGQITCHNAKHGGAVFVVRIPAAASDAEARKANPELAAQTS